MRDFSGYRYGGTHTTAGTPIAVERIGCDLRLRFADMRTGYIEELRLQLASVQEAKTFQQAARTVGAEGGIDNAPTLSRPRP